MRQLCPISRPLSYSLTPIAGTSPVIRFGSFADIRRTYQVGLLRANSLHRNRFLVRPSSRSPAVIRHGASPCAPIRWQLGQPSGGALARSWPSNHAGQALNAVLTMARNSLGATPPAACTAMPCMTVATKRASAAASASEGKSPSLLARFRRLRISASTSARREARSRFTASHSSPPDSALLRASLYDRRPVRP